MKAKDKLKSEQNRLIFLQDAAAADSLKELGPMSDEEYNYYQNL